MKLRVIISALAPVFLLVVLVFGSETAEKASPAFADSLEYVANVLVFWPLKLVELMGIMGNNPEGFYNRWADWSLGFSLLVQASLVYFVLAKTPNHALHGTPLARRP